MSIESKANPIVDSDDEIKCEVDVSSDVCTQSMKWIYMLRYVTEVWPAECYDVSGSQSGQCGSW